MKRRIINISASDEQLKSIRRLSTAERAEKLRDYAQKRKFQRHTVYRIVITCDDDTMNIIHMIPVGERGHAFDDKG